MKYVHTNIIADDWRMLSAFYQKVFGCRPIGPQRNLSGQWIEDMTGIPGVHIEGEHLALPGFEANGPTLEIFSYSGNLAANKQVNTSGFAHIAFAVENVERAVDAVLAAGGRLHGKIVRKDYGDMGIGTFVYVKDPEGNLIELQNWG